MARKVLLGGIAGAAVIFLQAGLYFGVLFADYFASVIPVEFTAVNRDSFNYALLVVADLLYAGLLAFLFASLDLRTFRRGVLMGAIIGFAVVLHFDLISAATTYLNTPGGIAANVAISTFMSALGGGVIAAVLGKLAARTGAI